MPNRSKIGFLCGLGGDRRGIGEYFRALDSAGIPAIGIAYDDYGLCKEILTIGDESGNGVEHVVVFHPTLASANPDYDLEPELAAERFYDDIIAKLPPEFDKRVWLIWGNEGRGNPEMFEWWGKCAHRFTTLALADDIKTLAFGWSAGTPEHGFWTSPAVKDWLMLAAANPGMVGVAVHEGTDPRINQPPQVPDWSPLINPPENDISGRYREMFAACDALGIARLPVFISECAWKYNGVPSVAVGMPHIDQAAKYYNRDKEVLGVSLWYLGYGPEYPNIATQLQKYIAPVTEYTLNTELDDNSVTPPAQIAHTIHLLPQDTTLTELQATTNYLHPTRSAFTYSADVAHAVMAAGIPDKSRVVIWDGQRWSGDIYAWMRARNITYLSRSFAEIMPDDKNPVEGLMFGPIFRVPYTLTSPFLAPRSYGLHEGADYDVNAVAADSKEPVLCLYNGTVDRVVLATGEYYNYVVVRHSRFNKVFYTWYAHLDAVYVKPGQSLSIGASIGELGKTGNATGEHAHVNLEVPGYGTYNFNGHEYADPALHIPPYKPPTAPEVRFGLHSRADGGDSQPDELYEFEIAKLTSIKILSSTSANTVNALRGLYPNAYWILRVFQEFRSPQGIRNITPAQFLEWNRDDINRALALLPHDRVIIELHNEPNLVAEGLTGTWPDGTGFNFWLLEVIALFRSAFPGIKLMYPGLSPGGYFPGVRQDHWVFMEQSKQALAACDALGIHLYWSEQYPMSSTLAVLDQTLALYPGKLVHITEASHNGDAAYSKKAQDYIKFWHEVGSRNANIGSISYFVASASDPAFANQVWTGNGIGVIVGGR